jgi:hypothetical protein
VKIKNPQDFWAGLMFMAFGLFFVIVALMFYQMGSAVRMGPAYFPVVLGGLLAVLGAIVFARSFMSQLSAEVTAVNLPFNIIDLAVTVGVFVAMTYLAKALSISDDYAMLASALIVSVLSIVYRPEAKALALILASSLAFAYLLKPLGLVLASAALIFISAYGGHEFKWKEVAWLTVVLVIFSVLVFVKGLTLPFPICPDFIETCPIR